MLKVRFLALVLGFLGVVPSLYAEGITTSFSKAGGANFLALDLGAYFTRVNSRIYTPELYQSHVSHVTGIARFRGGFHLGKRYFFEPSFGVLLPWQRGADGDVKGFSFHWDLNFLVPFFSFLRFRLGPGMQSDFIVTNPEEIDLNNGTEVSTFYIPGGTSVVFMATVRSGLEILFSQRFSLNLDVVVQSLANDLRRSFQASLALGYRL